MKHQLGQAGKAWFARIPMAETSDMLDYMSYAEVDELAFEAWEHMTYGGVGSLTSYDPDPKIMNWRITLVGKHVTR